jgi:hypothetical protein
MIVLTSVLETVKQNSKVIYVSNRLSELYDHMWLLLVDQWRDHITERLQLRALVQNIASDAVKAEIEKEKEKQA